MKKLICQVLDSAAVIKNARTRSVPCDREGALEGLRSGPLSASARGAFS